MQFRTVAVEAIIYRAILGVGMLCCTSILVSAQDKDATTKDQEPVDHAAIISEMGLSNEQASALEFAADQQTPIFVYGTSGGMGVRPKANGKMGVAPKLQLFADGRIVVSGGPGVPDVQGKMSAKEHIEFLNFVVNAAEYYQLDSKAIAKTIGGKKDIKVLDSPSTVFIVELGKRRHDVAVYALWSAIKNFPEDTDIKKLAAIEKHCTRIISNVSLGDRGEAVLKLVNTKVAELNLGLKPFKLEEMRLANQMGNGRFQARFTRKLPGAKAKRIPPTTMHVIYFKKDSETEPEVTFYGLPRPQVQKR